MSQTKDFLKKVVLTQAQFSARQSAGTLQEGVEYEISDATSVDDVQINGTSILSSGVANIPVGNGVLGVLKADGYYQLQLDSGNAIYAKSISYANYDSGSANLFVGKGTLETVLDNESVRFDKATSLTDTQKAQARTNIGAISASEVPVELPVVSSEDNGKFLRVVNGVWASATIENASGGSY